MLRLLADFNEIVDDVITKRIGRTPNHETLNVRDAVLLYDDGEHEVLAKVVGMDAERVRFEVIWSTWGPNGHLRIMTDTVGGNDGFQTEPAPSFNVDEVLVAA